MAPPAGFGRLFRQRARTFLPKNSFEHASSEASIRASKFRDMKEERKTYIHTFAGFRFKIRAGKFGVRIIGSNGGFAPLRAGRNAG